MIFWSNRADLLRWQRAALADSILARLNDGKVPAFTKADHVRFSFPGASDSSGIERQPAHSCMKYGFYVDDGNGKIHIGCYCQGARAARTECGLHFDPAQKKATSKTWLDSPENNCARCREVIDPNLLAAMLSQSG